MILFRSEKKISVLIIGCGRFGSRLAGKLSDENKNVTVIDISQNAFRRLSPAYGGFAIEGDGSDVDLLRDSGAGDADVIIVTTNDDDINIMAAQFAKQVFHTPKVIARIKDSSKLAVLKDMEIDTICPSDLSVIKFDELMCER